MNPFAGASVIEAASFCIFAIVALAGALGTVLARKAVHAAICLALTMIVLAMCYIALDAVFLGIVQVVVYTGAVMMLFLFVLMLIGIDSGQYVSETLRGQRFSALVIVVGLTAVIGGSIAHTTVGAARHQDDSSLPALARLLFVDYVWAFELTGALLITAALAAMVLAHRERFEAPRTQSQQTADRAATRTHLTPRPPSGVYAIDNAVDLPARLPDGSDAPSSVIASLRPRSPGAASAQDDQ